MPSWSHMSGIVFKSFIDIRHLTVWSTFNNGYKLLSQNHEGVSGEGIGWFYLSWGILTLFRNVFYCHASNIAWLCHIVKIALRVSTDTNKHFCFRSFFKCGTICKNSDGCHSFKHDQDQQVCKLASSKEDWCVPNSQPGGPFDDIYSDADMSILKLESGESSKKARSICKYIAMGTVSHNNVYSLKVRLAC